MKQNIKRFVVLLMLTVCVFSMTACGSKNNTSEVDMLDPQTASYVCQVSEDLLRQICSFTEEQAVQVEADLRKEKQTALADGVAAWVNVMDDTGAYIGAISSETTLNEDEEYVCVIYAQYANRNVEYKIFYTLDDQGLAPASMTFSPEYTVAENMTKAALNTLMGMGIVFVVLIFLSLLISCFKYIHIAEEKMRQKKEPAPAAAAPAQAAPIVAEEPAAEEEELVDDLELVAVITAAIAAAADTPADGLVVRSIRRASAAKWKRA